MRNTAQNALSLELTPTTKLSTSSEESFFTGFAIEGEQQMIEKPIETNTSEQSASTLLSAADVFTNFGRVVMKAGQSYLLLIAYTWQPEVAELMQ
jgi:hypothetical protein